MSANTRVSRCVALTQANVNQLLQQHIVILFDPLLLSAYPELLGTFFLHIQLSLLVSVLTGTLELLHGSTCDRALYLTKLALMTVEEAVGFLALEWRSLVSVFYECVALLDYVLRRSYFL